MFKQTVRFKNLVDVHALPDYYFVCLFWFLFFINYIPLNCMSSTTRFLLTSVQISMPMLVKLTTSKHRDFIKCNHIKIMQLCIDCNSMPILSRTDFERLCAIH